MSKNYLERSVVDGTGGYSSRQSMVVMLLESAQLLHNVWLLLQQVEVLLLLLIEELLLLCAAGILRRVEGDGGSPFLRVSSWLHALDLDWVLVLEGRLQNWLEMWRRQRETGGRQC